MARVDADRRGGDFRHTDEAVLAGPRLDGVDRSPHERDRLRRLRLRVAVAGQEPTVPPLAELLEGRVGQIGRRDPCRVAHRRLDPANKRSRELGVRRTHPQAIVPEHEDQVDLAGEQVALPDRPALVCLALQHAVERRIERKLGAVAIELTPHGGDHSARQLRHRLC